MCRYSWLILDQRFIFTLNDGFTAPLFEERDQIGQLHIKKISNIYEIIKQHSRKVKKN